MRTMVLAGLLVAVAAWTGSAQESTPPVAAPSPSAEYRVDDYPADAVTLIDAPGRAKVQAYCSVCHSTTYITLQPPLPRRTWDAEVHKMIKVHGADIGEADAQEIIDYLAAHYGPDTIGTTYGPQLERGRTVYETSCTRCHQADGEGIAHTFTPVAKSIQTFAASAAGRTYLEHALLFGLPARSDKQVSNGGMPPTSLSDDDVAAVLTYVTVRWSTPPATFTSLQVHQARQAVRTPEQVLAERPLHGGK